MQQTFRLFLVLFAIGLIGVSCKEEDSSDLSLDISGLEDLGPNYKYEGWLIVDGQAITTGVFDVNANGELSQNSFEIDQDVLDGASTFVLTIEPSPDNDPGPSAVHILAGDFNADNAALTINHPAALNNDFLQSTGSYILATPTDSDSENEASGIWWLDPSQGPGAGLDLPVLPNGWVYEGWVVIDGTPVTTGTFTSLNSPDDNAPFSGALPGPPFPGEDFLQNSPNSLSFPTDLRNGTAVISIEPVPDNSAAPFLLKPLVSAIPSNAEVHTSISMTNNAQQSSPTGGVSKN